MKNLGIAFVAVVLLYAFPQTLHSSAITWLNGIGGIFTFTGCVALSIFLERLIGQGYISISSKALSIFNIFLLVIALRALMYAISGPYNYTIYTVSWQLVAGFMSLWMAWSFLKTGVEKDTIYSQGEMEKLKAVSKFIQEKGRVGFWWYDGSTMHWSSGTFALFGKPPSWTIDIDELNKLVETVDLHKVLQTEGSWKIKADQRYLSIKTFLHNGYSCGVMSDITQELIEQQELQIRLNDLQAKLLEQEAAQAVANIIKNESRRYSDEGS